MSPAPYTRNEVGFVFYLNIPSKQCRPPLSLPLVNVGLAKENFALDGTCTNISTCWAVPQVIGKDFSENTPGVASLALAVGRSAGWLVHDASSKSKHTKTLPTSGWAAQYLTVAFYSPRGIVEHPPTQKKSSLPKCIPKLHTCDTVAPFFLAPSG